MRLLDSVLGDFRTRTVLLCASVGNTCKTSRSSNISIASLLTLHNVLLICNEFCSQLISSHVNANNSPLRSVHTKDSSIANRSHDTLQWCKRSWICSGDRNTDGADLVLGSAPLWKGLRSTYSHRTACSKALCSSLCTLFNVLAETDCPSYLWYGPQYLGSCWNSV